MGGFINDFNKSYSMTESDDGYLMLTQRGFKYFYETHNDFWRK